MLLHDRPPAVELDAWAVAEAIAAHDLPGTRPAIDPDAVPDDRWDDVVALCTLQRLEAPLVWALHRGGWSAPDRIREQAATAHRRAMTLTLLLERDLVGIAAELDARAIGFRVLKGCAAARLDEPDPAGRAFGDIDLLVRGDDLHVVGEVLGARGGRRRFAEPRPGFDARFSKGASYRIEPNCEVDLHRTLAAGPFGLTIDLEELFAGATTFAIAGVELPALDRASRFIHACCHATLGGERPRLTALRDIVRTAPTTVEDLRVVTGRARRWQLELVVATALQSTTDAFGWTPTPELSAWVATTRHLAPHARWLTSYQGGERSYAAQMIQGVQALPGLGEKLSYAWAIAVPASAPGRAPARDRWRRGARALRRTLRRRPRSDRTR